MSEPSRRRKRGRRPSYALPVILGTAGPFTRLVLEALSVVVFLDRNGGSEDTAATVEISTEAWKDLSKPHVVCEPSLGFVPCTISPSGILLLCPALSTSSLVLSVPLVASKLGFSEVQDIYRDASKQRLRNLVKLLSRAGKCT